MKASLNHRRGWSLLELLVVIPLMAILLTISSVLLTAVLRSQGMLWADMQQQSARVRLAVQLRADAHEATDLKCPFPQVCDILLPSGEAVHYEIKENALHRELRQKETVVGRQSFPLSGLTATFAVDESQERPLVRLSLETVAERVKYSRPARASVLEAAVGIRNRPESKGPQP